MHYEKQTEKLLNSPAENMGDIMSTVRPEEPITDVGEWFKYIHREVEKNQRLKYETENKNLYNVHCGPVMVRD